MSTEKPYDDTPINIHKLHEDTAALAEQEHSFQVAPRNLNNGMFEVDPKQPKPKENLSGSELDNLIELLGKVPNKPVSALMLKEALKVIQDELIYYNHQVRKC